MGVPQFFKWLITKYPRITTIAVERPEGDYDAPNPNGECDAFYLDMNGIIHQCSHPDDKPKPKSEEEIRQAMEIYIDMLIAFIKPRKLLYMAIDGVAPRAKMNQQRARRFLSVREGIIQKKLDEEAAALGLRNGGEKKHEEVEPEQETKFKFDSNCITPGTEFMANVSIWIQQFIVNRLNYSPAWKNLKVIFSDSGVPGEGEHKIMQYIRSQRIQPDYDPNTRHVIFGPDADLILLGLASHEAHLIILRENPFHNTCVICGALHSTSECPEAEKLTREDKWRMIHNPFHLLDISKLRKYLEIEFNVKRPAEQKDNAQNEALERVVDDFVFLCTFVGNDFLPHLPTLSIREGAIDLLISIYKKVLPEMGYVTENGNINLQRLECLLDKIGLLEFDILEKRHKKEKRTHLRNKMKQNMSKEGGRMEKVVIKINEETSRNSIDYLELDEEAPIRIVRDNTLLHGGGHKNLYYDAKFGEEHSKDTGFFPNLIEEYVLGLAWVAQYYYQGCPSWSWYYPYHYAPFACDFAEHIGSIAVKFVPSEPFRPLEQLMAVLPPESHACLPHAYAELMTSETSEIAHFYREKVTIDMSDGKTELWQGVVILPFLDENVLKHALTGLTATLTETEQERNRYHEDILSATSTNVLASAFAKLEHNEKVPLCHKDYGIAGDMKGAKYIPDIIKEMLHSDVHYAIYCPPDVSGHLFISKLLEGVEYDADSLSVYDVESDMQRNITSYTKSGLGVVVQNFGVMSMWPPVNEKSKGFKLLQKLGWNGGGLGKEAEGRVVPIDIIDKGDRCGMGYKEDAFQRLLEAKEKREKDQAARGAAFAPKDPREEKKLHEMGSDFQHHVRVMLEELKELADSSEVVNEIRFPPTITSEERKLVHKMARQMNLNSKSYGAGDNRYLTVSSRSANDEKKDTKHWRCVVCDCLVPEDAKAAHQSGKKHSARLDRIPLDQQPGPDEDVFEEVEAPQRTHNVRDFVRPSDAVPPPPSRPKRGRSNDSFRGDRGRPSPRSGYRDNSPGYPHQGGGNNRYRTAFASPAGQQSPTGLRTVNLNQLPRIPHPSPSAAPQQQQQPRQPKRHQMRGSREKEKEEGDEGADADVNMAEERSQQPKKKKKQGHFKERGMGMASPGAAGGGYFGSAAGTVNASSPAGLQAWFSSQQPTPQPGTQEGFQQQPFPTEGGGQGRGGGGRGGRGRRGGFRGGRGGGEYRPKRKMDEEGHE